MPKHLGTLLPITALTPKRDQDLFSLGKDFIDWLVRTKQNVWQLLPIHQIDRFGMEKFSSPYHSYGIGINPSFYPREAYGHDMPDADPAILQTHAFWIHDYALYMALSEKFENDLWTEWPIDLRSREESALEKATHELADRIDFYTRQQALLLLQWDKLHEYATQQGVELWGDMPFYLGLNSPLTWKYQEAFMLKNYEMEYTTGNAAGGHFGRQEWGHPMFNWQSKSASIAIKQQFLTRIQFLAKLFDMVRVDHGIGFYQPTVLHTVVPAKDYELPINNDELIQSLVHFAKTQNIDMFFETITGKDLAPLRHIIDQTGTKGVSVLTLSQAGSTPDKHSNYFHQDRMSSHDIAYTSTHDTPTLLGYLQSLSPKKYASLSDVTNVKLLGKPPEDTALLRNTLIQRSQNAVIALQDWLIDNTQINYPGTVSSKNWSYTIPMPISELPLVVE